MRGLRGRLGTVVGIGTFVLVLVGGMLITVERWQEEKAGLAERVTLAALRLSEADDPLIEAVSVGGSTESIVLLLDDPPDVLRASGPADDTFIDQAIQELWPETVEQDTTVGIVNELGDRLQHVTAATCLDDTQCDTAIVAATEVTAASYLGARWAWILLPALFLGLGALVLSRLIVARSLRPVDRMRAELSTITSSDLDRRVSTPDSGDEIERLGTAMNATLDRLGHAVAANQRFVADAAHELRSPITGVRAALELEAAKAPGSILDDGVQELDRASRLIDDLLLLARGEGTGTRRVDVDLDDVVGEQLSLVGTRYPDLHIDRSVSPVRVIGDPDALRRVVANLLENAARHGSGAVRVELAANGLYAELSVGDNGSGIAPVDRARVFERFARLDEARARSTGGSGLGLAIVAELVELHEGTIEIDDSPLGGARFVCQLPIG